MELLKGVRSDVALEIRRMPDFVMQNPKNKRCIFCRSKISCQWRVQIKGFTEKLSLRKRLYYTCFKKTNQMYNGKRIARR